MIKWRGEGANRTRPTADCPATSVEDRIAIDGNMEGIGIPFGNVGMKIVFASPVGRYIALEGYVEP